MFLLSLGQVLTACFAGYLSMHLRASIPATSYLELTKYAISAQRISYRVGPIEKIIRASIKRRVTVLWNHAVKEQKKVNFSFKGLRSFVVKRSQIIQWTLQGKTIIWPNDQLRNTFYVESVFIVNVRTFFVFNQNLLCANCVCLFLSPIWITLDLLYLRTIPTNFQLKFSLAFLRRSWPWTKFTDHRRKL